MSTFQIHIWRKKYSLSSWQHFAFKNAPTLSEVVSQALEAVSGTLKQLASLRGTHPWHHLGILSPSVNSTATGQIAADICLEQCTVCRCWHKVGMLAGSSNYISLCNVLLTTCPLYGLLCVARVKWILTKSHPLPKQELSAMVKKNVSGFVHICKWFGVIVLVFNSCHSYYSMGYSYSYLQWLGLL